MKNLASVKLPSLKDKLLEAENNETTQVEQVVRKITRKLKGKK